MDYEEVETGDPIGGSWKEGRSEGALAGSSKDIKADTFILGFLGR